MRYLILLILFFNLNLKGQIYEFDVQNSSTYSYNCGTITGSYWGVKNDSCSLTTSPILVNGCYSGSLITLPINVKINQTGQLSCSDTAWISYTIDGGITFEGLDTIIGCQQTANTSYWYYPEVPGDCNFYLKVTFKNTSPTSWWQIMNGDISINDPCFLLSISGINLKSEGNSLILETDGIIEDVQEIILESSQDGKTFIPTHYSWSVLGHSPLNIKLSIMNNPNKYYRATLIDNLNINHTSNIIEHKNTYNEPETVSIFPSPSNGNINIHSLSTDKKIYNVNILNSSGNVILGFINKLDETINIDLKPFGPGYYYINIRSENEVITKKVLVLE